MSIGLRLPVIVATLRPQEIFDRCMQSLRDQGPAQAEIYLVQQSLAVNAQCYGRSHGATVLSGGRNLGLSGAWNLALRTVFTKGYEVAMLLNDDMVLTDVRTLTVLRDIYVCCPRQLRYLHDRGFSAIVISRAVWEEVGEFDEGFWPAFFEDNDYHWRCKLAGIPWDEVLVDTEHVGSGTLKADPAFATAHTNAFAINADRYRQKWGSGPHHETFQQAWNGGDPKPSTRDILPFEICAALEQPWAAEVPV